MELGTPVGQQSAAVKRWYALYVRSHHEVAVGKQLALRGIEFYLALYSAVHFWNNRCSKCLELPLFPGYVFVHIGPWERASVLGVQGVVHLVGATGRPIPLPDDEIEALRLGIAERKPQPHPPLEGGQRVRIRRGPLAGLEGTLKRSPDGPRVVITLSIISQGASVEVHWNEVEAIDPSPTSQLDGPGMRTSERSQDLLAPVTCTTAEHAQAGLGASTPRDFSPHWKY